MYTLPFRNDSSPSCLCFLPISRSKTHAHPRVFLPPCVTTTGSESRALTLGGIVITMWLYTALNLVALQQYQQLYNGPQESIYNIFLITSIYVVLIPALPFSLVSLATMNPQ